MCDDLTNRPVGNGFKTISNKPCGTLNYEAHGKPFENLSYYMQRVFTIRSPSDFAINFSISEMDMLRYGQSSQCVLDTAFLMSSDILEHSAYKKHLKSSKQHLLHSDRDALIYKHGNRVAQVI